MSRSTVFLLACLVLTPRNTVAQRAVGYAGADSADVADDLLANVDPADAADVVDALEVTSGWEGRPVARRAWFARLEAVSGYRTSERVTAGAHGVAFGVRRDESRTVRWADVRSSGWMERLTVGSFRVRAGERLVLGARRSRFATVPAAYAAGMKVDPSLSLWSSLHGAAITLRHRSCRLTSVGWNGRKGASGCWASLEHAFATGAMSVSGGSLVEAEEEGGERRVGLSISAVRDSGTHRVSGEIARLDNATLAAVRTTVRSAGEWIVEVFGGAADASGGVVSVSGDAPARERGASLHRRDEWARWRSTVSLHAVRRRDRDGERLRRRVDVRGAFTSSSGHRCDLSARYDLDAETDVPAGLLAERVVNSRSQRGRIRARLDLRVGASLSFRYHVQTLLAAASRPGHISGLDVRHDGHRVDARVSLTNFALSSGSSGYLSRPGIAGFESVTTVERRGSDVSARASIDLGCGVAMTAYAGVPWGREPRYLLSFKWRL